MKQFDRIILYGAVANTPARARMTIKTHLKIILDRIIFRAGYKLHLNYKNYQQPYTYNRGDNSIIIATAQKIQKFTQDKALIPSDWDKLHLLNLTPKDKILICGSGYFFPNSEGKFPQRIISDLNEIRNSGAELHFLGVGYNHLLGWKQLNPKDLPSASKNLVISLLGLSSTLTVRDENTRRFLAHFTSKNISVIGDPALFIETPSISIPSPQKSNATKIGINLPFHGPEATKWLKNNLTRFIWVLHKLKNETKCEFTYFIHYDSENLIAKLIRDSGISLKILDRDAINLPEEYAKMDIHIGGMLHSCIIATAANTPSIGLAYDEKHHGFFELIERPVYCINANPFNPDDLLKKSLNLLKNVESEKVKIKKIKNKLEYDFEIIIQKILKTKAHEGSVA